MTISYVGELTIGAAIPGANAAVLAGIAGINSALPDILARIAALQAFAPQPVNFAVQLQLAQQMVASVQACLLLGIPAPTIAAQIAAVAALIAELLAAVSGVNAQLVILTDFQALLATAGLFVYAYAGTSGALGADVTTALVGGTPGGSPADACNALVLVTTSSPVWTALSQVMQVTP